VSPEYSCSIARLDVTKSLGPWNNSEISPKLAREEIRGLNPPDALDPATDNESYDTRRVVGEGVPWLDKRDCRDEGDDLEPFESPFKHRKTVARAAGDLNPFTVATGA